MRTHTWTDRLSEYVDDELDAAERGALEAHLAECDECTRVLADLQAVVAAARSLPDRAPARNLWAGIEAQIKPAKVTPIRSRRSDWASRRFSFSMPQLAAAAVVGVLLAGGAVWTVLATGGPGGVPMVQRPDAGMADGSDVALAAFSTGYEDAVFDLERVLAEGRDRLDPATIAVLEANLRIIDQAVAESRDALARDPSNAYLSQYLADSMRRKLQLLRQATDIVRADT